MPQPMVYDARQGLSAPALAALSRAVRLDLAAKNATTTVIGCWVRGEGPRAQGGDELRAIVLDGDQERGSEGGLVVSTRLLSRWDWPEVVGRLQVGDLLRAKWGAHRYPPARGSAWAGSGRGACPLLFVSPYL